VALSYRMPDYVSRNGTVNTKKLLLNINADIKKRE
jgi:hypothetical protein